jgi:flagellar export protein FliJ
MTPRPWVASLLRARQIQEDVARGRFAQAQRAVQDAADATEASERHVDQVTSEIPQDCATAFIAAASARQAAGASWLLARRELALAEDHQRARAAALTVAARHRRGVEKLAERDAAELAARASAAEQQALDEISPHPASPVETS